MRGSFLSLAACLCLIMEVSLSSAIFFSPSLLPLPLPIIRQLGCSLSLHLHLPPQSQYPDEVPLPIPAPLKAHMEDDCFWILRCHRVSATEFYPPASPLHLATVRVHTYALYILLYGGYSTVLPRIGGDCGDAFVSRTAAHTAKETEC